MLCPEHTQISKAIVTTGPFFGIFIIMDAKRLKMLKGLVWLILPMMN
jgi:hypothetical protein